MAATASPVPEIAAPADPKRRRMVLKDGKDVGRLLPDTRRAWARPLSFGIVTLRI